jgi:hypothetical protein
MRTIRIEKYFIILVINGGLFQGWKPAKVNDFSINYFHP